jgi:general secretion pathway protein H
MQRTQRSQHGFTLLELMVVIVLIGIILTFVVRSVGDGGRRDRIQREAQRITALVEMVGEEAVLQSSVMGMHFLEHGYEFMRYNGQKWKLIEKDELLRQRTLDPMIEMQLMVEGFRIDLEAVTRATASGDEDEGEDEEKEGPKPQVVFLSSGERSAFELTLVYEDDESGFLLTVPPLGGVEQRWLEGRR